MIRFYNRQIVWQNDMEVIVASEHVLADERLWDDGKEYFRRNLTADAADIQLLPVINEKQEVIFHAYQDREADRELRMLKELEQNKEALQFQDIFPEFRHVVVYGCNELAYRFVKYLEGRQIPVTVAGKYWNYFGYESALDADEDDTHKLVVYAEDIIPRTGDLFQTVIRSASPEFECIDKIYEANVLEGRIKDTKGDLKKFLEKLRKKEVVIFGTDAKAQDAYDFLFGHGIDICCFAEWRDEKNEGIHRTLLGKHVFLVDDVVNDKRDAVFIDCNDKNSALGTENVEIFDYYGYERNEQFFLIRDYTDVPCTKLLHVLKGKKVFFAGDEYLCAMIFDYLKDKEQGNIDLVYIEVSQCAMMQETNILCLVNPWIGSQILQLEGNPKAWSFWNTLLRQEVVSYSDYFAQIPVLVDVEIYRSKDRKKYSVKELLPKGILLGRIPGVSGNVFFRGILDGHPNILKWGFNHLNNNLFLYCIRLAGEKAKDILACFKQMYREEFAFRQELEFSCWDKFEESAEAMLSLKESFTSQELFVIFHIAFEEMLRGYRITDLNQKIIYWEPHRFPRECFPSLAQWLEDEQINGQTIFIHRDNIVWTGSCYKNYFNLTGIAATGIFEFVPGGLANDITADDVNYRYWEEFHVRFEDLKLHPQRELRKLCDRIGFPWSDVMLRVTNNGQAWSYRGICDFDLKPVFNKHEEILSEFDRFRISLISSPYQIKYGYTYEDCMKFSRKELQEMFLKEFRFQRKLRFKQEKDKEVYFLRTYKILMTRLWKVRNHMLMDDIVPEFGEVQIGESIVKKQKGAEIAGYKEIDRLLRFIRQEKRLVLYGTGRDCEGLLEHLDEEEQSGLVFSDLKAEYMERVFHGRQVVAPRELCGKYKDYKILITSSQFYKNMQQWLEDMGVAKDRITCNTFQLWEKEL